MQASSATPQSQPKSVPPISIQPVTVYHWLVVILAACGWLFDCFGQRIFVLSREPALKELLGAAASDAAVRLWGTLATTALMVGWATGGILFGIFSDRYGRVRAMIITLLAYTLFSGMSGFAHSALEFLVWRLLFGLGVGGMFGAATTLVAESVPPRVRTVALGTMQALSACGNMMASALSLKIVPGLENFWGHYSGWQVLSFAGVFPALFVVPMALILKEPESWKRAKAEAASSLAGGKSVGSISDLFRQPRWRHNLVIGVCLGVAGMVGLWGIAFFSPELITTALKNRPLQSNEIRGEQLWAGLQKTGDPAVGHVRSRLAPEPTACLAQPVSPAAVEVLAHDLNRILQAGSLYDTRAFAAVNLKKNTRNLLERVEKNNDPQDVNFLNRQLVEQVFPGAIAELQKTIDKTRSRGTLLQDVGALLGMFGFTFAAAFFNRRTAFLGAFVLCLVSVAFVFYALKTEADVYWMLPLMGFATLSVFAGYSIYFPEIFPTRLRGTGVGFCYNTVRYLAAPFPFLLGALSTHFPFRAVAVVMSGIYLVGIIALVWAPETKGKPLPED
jgi:MFS family permease